jgi:hypothetical protein
VWPSATVQRGPLSEHTTRLNIGLRSAGAQPASDWAGPRGVATALPRARTRVRLHRVVRALGSRSGKATGERTAVHSGQDLPGECNRLKVHTRGKLWSSNSRRAKVATERGGTHRRPEAARWGWPAVSESSGSRHSSTTRGSLGRRRDIGMERGRPWCFSSSRRCDSARTTRVSSRR